MSTALFRMPLRVRSYGLASRVCREAARVLLGMHVRFSQHVENGIHSELERVRGEPEPRLYNAHKHCMAGGPNDDCCCDACNAQVAILVLERALDPEENEGLMS